MQACKAVLGCVEMHLGDYHYSQLEPLTSIAAEMNVAPAVDYKIEANSPADQP